MLRVILGRLPGSGVAGASCVARTCIALKAKARLKCGAMATGLQSIIRGRGAGHSAAHSRADFGA